MGAHISIEPRGIRFTLTWTTSLAFYQWAELQGPLRSRHSQGEASLSSTNTLGLAACPLT